MLKKLKKLNNLKKYKRVNLKCSKMSLDLNNLLIENLKLLLMRWNKKAIHRKKAKRKYPKIIQNRLMSPKWHKTKINSTKFKANLKSKKINAMKEALKRKMMNFILMIK
jgi:hypothetical protein